MFSLDIVLVALTLLTTLPTTTSLNLNIKPIKINSPTGPHSLFLSNRIAHFGIANVWATPGGAPPYWLRPIDVTSTTILLDNLIDTYSAHEPEDIATYNSTGPESSTVFAGFDTRLIVKPWVAPIGSPVPAVTMRNKEIVRAAELARDLYASTPFPKKEWGWVMCYVDDTQRYFRYCTGVLIVQRDLWYALDA